MKTAAVLRATRKAANEFRDAAMEAIKAAVQAAKASMDSRHRKTATTRRGQDVRSKASARRRTGTRKGFASKSSASR